MSEIDFREAFRLALAGAVGECVNAGCTRIAEWGLEGEYGSHCTEHRDEHDTVDMLEVCTRSAGAYFDEPEKGAAFLREALHELERTDRGRVINARARAGARLADAKATLTRARNPNALAKAGAEVRAREKEYDDAVEQEQITISPGHNQACRRCKVLCNAFAGNPNDWPVSAGAEWLHAGCAALERYPRVESVADCDIRGFSDRTCERGTSGCTVVHGG